MRKIISYIKNFIPLNKIFSLFRSTKPVSSKFGLDRGQPIDRYYIEKFLSDNSKYIHGNVLEIAESTYSKKFGKDVKTFGVLNFTADNPNATAIGDLAEPDTLPENRVDCFICTQTFNFIYDIRSAIKGARRLLKPEGTLLATVAGLCQISKYDMERWGDYWRFTTLSARKLFEEEFGKGNVTVDFYGNCLAACSLLKGLSSQELTRSELEFKDENYQVLITILAQKK